MSRAHFFALLRASTVLGLLFFLTACSSTLKQIQKLPVAGPAQGTVEATWFGTASIYISDGKTGILIDPFVSRHRLRKVAFGRDLPVQHSLIREWTHTLDSSNTEAVLVSHSHYDHSMDAPYFALETSAALVGSTSTLNVGRGAKMSESQMLLVTDTAQYTFGDFTIRFLESSHGTMRGKPPNEGTIAQPLTAPSNHKSYKLGTAYGILIQHPDGTILHHASANIKDGMYDGIEADVVMLGLALRDDTSQYISDVVDAVGAKRVIPIHWDDFFQPLDESLDDLIGVDLKEFRSSLSLRPDLAVEWMKIGQKQFLF